VTVASLKPMRLFHYSISYLSILFLAVAVDPLLHLPFSA
jgi:protoheme IX farnesyltransferase